MNHNYKNLENLLVRLLALLSEKFSNTEVQEVQEFIDVGEYGLALETLVDIVDEGSKQITSEVLILVKELAEAMEMDDKVLVGKISGYVLDD